MILQLYHKQFHEQPLSSSDCLSGGGFNWKTVSLHIGFSLWQLKYPLLRILLKPEIFIITFYYFRFIALNGAGTAVKKLKPIICYIYMIYWIGNKKLDFRMEDAQPSEMMRLSEIPDQVYLGEQLVVSCNVSNYYFAGGTRLALKFADSDIPQFLKSRLQLQFSPSVFLEKNGLFIK